MATGADGERTLDCAEHEEGDGDIEGVGWGDNADWTFITGLGSPAASLPRNISGRLWTSDLTPEDGGQERALAIC